MKPNTSRQSDFPCPHCGELVPAGARFCRECGSSAECGWDADAAEEFESGGDFSSDDDEFDYDDFVRREFPVHHRSHEYRSSKSQGHGSSARRPLPLSRQIWVAWIILALVAGLLAGTIW